MEAHERARTILSGEREVLERLARMLLDKEEVDREQLRSLLGTPARQSEDHDRPEVGHVPRRAASW